MNIETENFENEPTLKNKIEGPKNNSFSVNPERGGIVMSMKLNGKEVLYMDYERFKDPNKSVRGGIPILFPMSGPPTEEGPFSKLKQHGFARDSDSWKIEENKGNELVESLESDDKTKEAFPYEFTLKIKSKMGEDGSITLTQEVENKGKNEMPISMGLHPYFNIPEGEKDKIKFDFSGGKEIEKEIKEWLEEKDGDFLKRIDNPKEEIKIFIPAVGTIKMNISEEYEKVWIWTEPDKNFICIEPVMRDNQNGEIVNGPKMIKSGEKFSANVKYSLDN
jgi:galactose mutarotase-like enzyme